MVHKTGGCVTCKKRKLKCDLSQPRCQRCKRIGRTCPGYPDESDLAFRSENEVVYAKFHRKQGRAKLHNENEIGFANVPEKEGTISKPLSRASSRSTSPGSPQNVLYDDIEELSINLFFRDYVVESCPKVCEGYLDFLPELFARSPDNSGLQNAVLAMAYANLAHKTWRKDLQLKATSFHQASLETVNMSLCDPLLATSDATMTAIILLALYECMSNGLASTAKVYHTHGQGLRILAHLRGSLLLYGKGPTLLQIANCWIQRRNIDLKCHPSSGDEKLVKLLDASSPASGVIMTMFHVSIFRANAYQDIYAGSYSSRIWNNVVLHEYEQLDSQFQEWRDDATISIPYQVAPGPGTPGDESNSTAAAQHHIYRGFWSASVWNKHRASWIILHQTLLDRIDATKPSFQLFGHRSKATLAIRSMIDEILASIPFSVGDLAPSHYYGVPKSVGAYFLIWVLRVVIDCPFASADQRSQTKDALIRIARKFGISCAASFAGHYTINEPPMYSMNLNKDMALERLNSDVTVQ